MGNPMSRDTQVGPITNKPQLEKVLNYIDIAKSEGAQTMLGGKRPSSVELGDGWFVEPTIFGGVRNSMRIAQEEVFGPVLSIIPFTDEDEALAIGNDIVYGLAAGVWTQNMRRALTMAERLRAGTVWINTYRAVSYLSPFGGYKRSGIGRENGPEGIEQYCEAKASGSPRPPSSESIHPEIVKKDSQKFSIVVAYTPLTAYKPRINRSGRPQRLHDEGEFHARVASVARCVGVRSRPGRGIRAGLHYRCSQRLFRRGPAGRHR
jgi:delta 1-pyrroline-5-carboxylate dehydrogenase